MFTVNLVHLQWAQHSYYQNNSYTHHFGWQRCTEAVCKSWIEFRFTVTGVIGDARITITTTQSQPELSTPFGIANRSRCLRFRAHFGHNAELNHSAQLQLLVDEQKNGAIIQYGYYWGGIVCIATRTQRCAIIERFVARSRHESYDYSEYRRQLEIE